MVAEDEQAIVRCETTTGVVTMKMTREWSPHGYDKAVSLFERHFYDNSHFFRVVPKFLVQFGISYSKDKELQAFARGTIPDDPSKKIPFKKGTISFAGSGKDSRNAQLFISYGSAPSLGTETWETPIGEVIEGIENAEKFYSYGDMPPWGKGPVQGKIHGHPEYIEEEFPKLDKFLHCKVERMSFMENEAKHHATANERELMQVDNYKPHLHDQMGFPWAAAVGDDSFSTYAGVFILSMMGLAMFVLNSRKKAAGKHN
eukprot:Nitzschia sp. Nitz4//scaffold206_size41850//20353//21492//NITZ4_007422-RA/size41850-snap-gene-0.4-mRNA-1//1//CDS//3329541565//697//frame0